MQSRPEGPVEFPRGDVEIIPPGQGRSDRFEAAPSERSGYRPFSFDRPPSGFVFQTRGGGWLTFAMGAVLAVALFTFLASALFVFAAVAAVGFGVYALRNRLRNWLTR